VTIDLNADVGEGLDDSALIPYLSSCNVACGMHAGDPSRMDETVALALSHGVRVGAHPGYPDREHFGRVFLEMSADAVERLVLYQIAALDGFVRSRGGTLTHVKPHGALYHAGGEFPDVARAIAEGVRRLRPSLVLVGPPESLLLAAGRDAGLPVAAEGFADRRYMPDGTLVPRSEADALLRAPDETAEQALSIAKEGEVRARDGSRLAVHVETICLHGDTPGAADSARAIRERFGREGIRIAPFDITPSRDRRAQAAAPPLH
jgi:UPF0271 protein